jgi:hypothetical protein
VALANEVSVIPAEAGIQEQKAILDPGFRRGDDFDDFCEAVDKEVPYGSQSTNC